MDKKNLQRGNVININWGHKKRIAIFDKYDKSMGNYDALHIYIELDDVSNELYMKCEDWEFSYDLEDIQYQLATEEEKEKLYNAIGKHFTEDYDKNWYNYFTDSSYFDVQDFLLDIFCIKVEEYDNNMIYPDFVDEIHHYIWDKLCKAMGVPNDASNVEEKSEMVNKQEFIAKLKKWLELETDWNMEYDEEGRNPNYSKIDELIKYMEE